MKSRYRLFIINILAAGVVFLAAVTSCTKEVGKIPARNLEPGACDTITFTKHIDPIIQAKCIVCHGPQPSGNNVQLTSYAQVKTQSDAGVLYGVIIEGPPNHPWMPQGSANGLPQNEKDLFNCWIQNGEKN